MNPIYSFDNKQEDQKFATYTIHWQEIFFSSSQCFSFVNTKPVVPGHVLVSPKRVVQKFKDLNPNEVTDMMIMAQKVGEIVSHAYEAGSLSFVIQDGKEAGQTVPHVHVHIMPRIVGDFKNNDEIYSELEKKDLSHFREEPKNPSPNRSQHELYEEASLLRNTASKLFNENVQ